MVIIENRIKDLHLVDKDCNSKPSPTKFDKMSPASTATTDNFPSEEIIGKRNSTQRDAVDDGDQNGTKRQKVTNEHNPVELD
jgi:hypothetical protein